MTATETQKIRPNALALLPLLLFLALFLGSGIYHTYLGTDFAFYQLKAPVAVLPALILAVFLARKPINQAINDFLEGASHPNLILMLMVFMLAGAFANVSSVIGSVDATVQFGLSLIPVQFVLPMLFIISAFIATAMGTSMGTIAACAPIAFGFTQATDLAVPLTIGAVIGGAMFGDNLSMISDTTIAATRSQNVTLRDKFKSNIWIALPASILAIVIYTVIGFSHHNAIEVKDFNAWLIIPYLVVFFLAFTRLHVLAVLMVGIVVSGLFGTIFTPEYSLVKFSNSIYDGFVNLFEVTLLSVFIGGLSAMLQKQGGLAWLLRHIYALSGKLRLARQRAGEVSIAFLVVFSNFFVANNTIAILLSGDVAREVASEYGVDPRRSASLLDIFSCVVQGVIPYGAQILLASSIASISPLALIGNVYYCWMLAIFAILAIFTGLGKPKTTASATV